jgi:hypothetical protein
MALYCDRGFLASKKTEEDTTATNFPEFMEDCRGSIQIYPPVRFI